MANLPPEPLDATPPLIHVAIDVFGPFYMHDGKGTTRTPATKKIYARIFVCMPSRAIHLEPLLGMDVTSFRNAFARFTSVRERFRTIFSDGRSNFISAKGQMEEAVSLKDIAGDLAQEDVEARFAGSFSSSWTR